ncbi:MAG: hypothetical protein ACJAZN_003305, partial [Planctomycetota bacterium]
SGDASAARMHLRMFPFHSRSFGCGTVLRELDLGP